MEETQNNLNNTLVLEDIGEASHSYEIQSIGYITKSDEVVGRKRIDVKEVPMATTLEDKENDCKEDQVDSFLKSLSLEN